MDKLIIKKKEQNKEVPGQQAKKEPVTTGLIRFMTARELSSE